MSGAVHHLAGRNVTLDPSWVCGGIWWQPHTGQCYLDQSPLRLLATEVWTLLCPSDARWSNHPVRAWRGLRAGAGKEGCTTQKSVSYLTSSSFFLHLPPVTRLLWAMMDRSDIYQFAQSNRLWVLKTWRPASPLQWQVCSPVEKIYFTIFIPFTFLLFDGYFPEKTL